MGDGTNEAMSSQDLEHRAIQLEADSRLAEARDAFEAALKLNPSSQPSIEGRARLAIQLREDGAADHCARALALHRNDPELQAQMIAVAAVELGTAVIPLLEEYLHDNPDDIRALELIADLRAQAGAGDDFVANHRAALAQSPANKALLMSYWSVLSRSGRHAQALESMDANRSLFGGNRDFSMLEIAIAGHSGAVDRATGLLELLDSQPDAQTARGMNWLQRHNPDEAAAALEGVVADQADNLEAWSLLELAWRMLGDPRHDWLVGQPGLYGSIDLSLDGSQLAGIASMLRQLHQASAQPIGQSVRGGTQTSGQLFMRNEPELQLLTAALADAIGQFHKALPAFDPRHPLLKHRNEAMAFGPSWSIRFTGSGFHAAHFHPGGILSSACYICVPESLADPIDRPGWLEIGRPPAEMGLDLPPLASFEPKPGRLVLFPSFLFHGTRPFAGGERLTVAFDVIPVR